MRGQAPCTRDGCCSGKKRSPITGIVSRRQRTRMGETCRFRHALNRMSRQVERPRRRAGRMPCTRDGVCLPPERSRIESHVETGRTPAPTRGPDALHQGRCLPPSRTKPHRIACRDRSNARAARAWMPEVEQCRSNCRTRGPDALHQGRCLPQPRTSSGLAVAPTTLIRLSATFSRKAGEGNSKHAAWTCA